jgi:hypothetical protein
VSEIKYPLDEDLKPLIPAEPYEPACDVVAWRISSDGCLLAEIYMRSNRTYGYRYNAWVVWRDASAEPRDHGWLDLGAIYGTITDQISVAKLNCDEESAGRGLYICKDWYDVV